jgi:hypothetical protein
MSFTLITVLVPLLFQMSILKIISYRYKYFFIFNKKKEQTMTNQRRQYLKAAGALGAMTLFQTCQPHRPMRASLKPALTIF